MRRVEVAPMTKQKRLIRIETSLTPKQAVRLWLRQELQGKTSSEYVRWMIRQPPGASPRSRVERQVMDAIRVAMKGEEPGRIYQAVRQGQMHTDFLILLVLRANSAVLDDGPARSWRIALFYEQLRNAALSGEEAVPDWIVRLREFATELLSLQSASEMIRNEYFEGETILLKDAIGNLELQTKAVQLMMDAHDRVAIEAGQPELATNSDKHQLAIHDRASRKADYIIALARSKMLHDFDEYEAADRLLKPYILEGGN
jgi:hypothetical protein